MVRARKNTAPPQGELGMVAGEGVDAAPDASVQDQTLDVLALSGDDGQKQPRARVQRWNERMGEYTTLDWVPAANVDESWIQKEYGGGKYLVYFWGTRADGSYGFLKKTGKQFSIDDSVPFRGSRLGRAVTVPPMSNDTPAAAVAPAANLMDMGLLQIFKTMQDNSVIMAQQNRDSSTALAAMLERLAAPRESAMEKLLPLLIPIITAFITAQSNKKDPMEMAREIAALTKPDGGISSLKDTLGALAEMRELVGTGNGENGEGGWMRLAEKVIPGAMEVLKLEAAKTPQPLLRPPARSIPAPGISAPATAGSAAPISTTSDSASSVAAPSASPASEASPVADEWTPLEPYIAQLVAMAEHNREPFGVMQTIKTLAPEKMLSAIRELVADDDGADMLVQRFPALQRHRAWVEQLLDEFHVEFFGADDPIGAEEPLEPDIHGDTTPPEE